MDIHKSKIFVTGGSGFIGSHLVEELIHKECEVTCFIEYNSESHIGLLTELDKETLSKVKLIFGNLSDAETLKSAMQGCEYLFHLGAIISIPYSYQSPRHTVQTNVIGTLNVLHAAKESGIKKMVHTSTSEVYGSAQYIPINESHPLVGQSPYSASKIGADKIAESFYLSYNLPVVTVRPFNCFGDRQSMRAVIPTIITQALKGNDIKLGNVDTTRDYTYVKDTVQGFIKAMETENNLGKVFNISSNFEISIKEIANKVIQQVNPNLKVIIDQKRIRPKNSEVLRLWGDNTLAETELNWKPNHSFDEGLKLTINYFKTKLQDLRVEEYHK
ncbi:SDR family NAD(P)-dependent oxidoreductase [archaeon]|nr:SDR family NAD(P)-dependent oxidoreductase [archaeon]MBT3451338.1 SDR family NAD(P)-dependent oxidoreductase [archaeon]MBT6869346.1 SDR family NAD(P)-dependent oxidoreductase [archaeon]MBT7192509.1 SDR family NAD(P)-dependent oxidoreductase [archaeon]MBT7380585.1 SDR family NAD(P)-dependent oxidoreductase [archaeon]